jgi:transposase
MAPRKYARHSAEFKAEAIRTARTAAGPLTQVARDLGVNVSTLRLWLDEDRPKLEVPLSEDERNELRRLRRENRELRMEREILKKATAFFAKHSE